MSDPIEIAAKALRKEADEFRDPVSSYVEGEALERAGLWQDGQAARLQKDWELESWKILARAVIAALEGAGVINNAAPRNLVEEIYEATKGLTMMVPRDIVGKFRASDGNYRVFSIENWQARARQFLDAAPTYTPPAEERK
jgi:hypothetical protein